MTTAAELRHQEISDRLHQALLELKLLKNDLTSIHGHLVTLDRAIVRLTSQVEGILYLYWGPPQ